MRGLFAATAAAGRPLQLPLADLRAYTSLCLDYHLREDPSGSAVLVVDGAVRGYVLVARDTAAHARWARGPALRWGARAVRRAAAGPASAQSRFHRLRLLDGVITLARGVPAPMPAHLHLNVEVGIRRATAGFALLAHADAVLAAAGLPGYFGEVNVARSAPGRAQAMGRLGGRVVHRQHNHTLSWLAGEPVERLTVVREVGGGGRRPG